MANPQNIESLPPEATDRPEITQSMIEGASDDEFEIVAEIISLGGRNALGRGRIKREIIDPYPDDCPKRTLAQIAQLEREQEESRKLSE